MIVASLYLLLPVLLIAQLDGDILFQTFIYCLGRNATRRYLPYSHQNCDTAHNFHATFSDTTLL